MKKIFSYILIIAMVAVITGCGATKAYVGEAKGNSKNEEISREIGRLNAFGEAAVKHDYSVEVVEKISTVDENGDPRTVFTSTKTGTSQVDFANNKITFSTRRKKGMYETTAVVKANANKSGE